MSQPDLSQIPEWTHYAITLLREQMEYLDHDERLAILKAIATGMPFSIRDDARSK